MKLAGGCYPEFHGVNPLCLQLIELDQVIRTFEPIVNSDEDYVQAQIAKEL